ncbi:hypothetical protein CFIMG_000118RAa [Ceratocystis fimbriata CBS 114723]|uniref:Uncharacterized protein n=1 Tax=Ceratocystis fimbriata CBS 114723 TaxID=1035309 RepID=A0A2C5XDN4_9PEZI|nr:hypothetical protein CFIMG_000118RAa [Ceratocystis fimbriata CBS 114723]
MPVLDSGQKHSTPTTPSMCPDKPKGGLGSVVRACILAAVGGGRKIQQFDSAYHLIDPKGGQGRTE